MKGKASTQSNTEKLIPNQIEIKLLNHKGNILHSYLAILPMEVSNFPVC
jgi:hypothetical protein